MEIEDLAKLLTGCNINVKGDLVMEKHVEHEVANVEAGGIGIQIIGDKKPKDSDGKEEEGSEEEGSTGENPEEENPEEENPEGEPPLKRGIKNKFLFPQNGNESVKNGRLTQCEKRRFLHYLSKHSLDGRMLVSTRDDAINKAVVCFVRIWKEQELTASKPSGRSIFRFLTQDCGLKTEITIESYANKMNEWLKEKQQDVLSMAEVKRCFAGI